MAATKRKVLVASLAMLAGVGLLAGVAYVAHVPPFEQRGAISAGDLCESLGDAGKAIPALEQALPSKSDYSFRDRVNGRVPGTEGDYTSTCSVNGDSEQLLTVRTEMMLIGPKPTPATTAGWTKEVKENTASRGPFKSFNAGNGAVASPGMSAVLLPCVPPGEIPGGEYDLSVVVTLKQWDEEASETKTRQSLIDLTRSAAHYAHKKARCGLAAKV